METNSLIKFIKYKKDGIESFGIFYKDNFIISKDKFECLKKFNSIEEVIENFTPIDADLILEHLKNNLDLALLININDIEVLSPIKKTRHDIICVGLNYKDHIREMKENFEINTTYFSKRVNFINNPNSEIKYDFSIDNTLDYEVELAIIIGKSGKNIKKEEAENYIFGYTILNDLTARETQKLGGQWYRGKSLDNLLTLGPNIVYKKNFDALNLKIKSIVNGEIRQSSNTKLMIKNIYEIIEEISYGLTLEPGDIISTGTCSGVGAGFNPPKYLKSKDKVECYIENIGILKNTIL